MSVYELGPKLGHGGMAAVYEATRVLSGNVRLTVACKRLHADIHHDPVVWQQFAQEAFLGFAVNNDHPNLVSVYDLIEDDDGRLCIIMELVRGCTLFDLIRVGLPLPEPLIRRIACELLTALAYIHGCSILHRDISPCNVLLSKDGAVKLSDLGLAKLLKEGRGRSPYFRGKVSYASPEQLRATTIDARSDLYAVGAVIYEMLCGVPPFGDERDRTRILARMKNGPPTLNQGVAEDLRELVRGLLQGARDSRQPASATEALDVIERHAYPIASREELADLVLIVQQRQLEQEPTRPGSNRSSTDNRITKRIGVRGHLRAPETGTGSRRRTRRRTMTIHSSFPGRAGRLSRWIAVATTSALVAVLWMWKPWHAPLAVQPAIEAPQSQAEGIAAALCEPSPRLETADVSPIHSASSDATSDASSNMDESAAHAKSADEPKAPEPAKVKRRSQRAQRAAERDAESDEHERRWAIVPKVERSRWHIYLNEDNEE
ncbi:serine/threonine-protein kinase [Haliangium ochraceum]|uniref:non-specific serine/threonine protein kinase n=1 Tax=Haliangium ochraceum (strain DSM 14365 / JCM 11303 / SMP-2) TaxID=502025 RepID=D0LP18_HALO1|nr:serine/threonine-protein kinase [Haliangium ochraceum]ACY18844.1 serine/threonine protein kinase [Haliangium ochraceum DSM 14365]